MSAREADEERWCQHCHAYRLSRWQPSPDAGPAWRCSECGEPTSEFRSERPILFSGGMVQTRRLVKLPRGYVMGNERDDGRTWPYFAAHADGDAESPWLRCPFGEIGDRLWVRETFGILTGNGQRTVYRADGEPRDLAGRPPLGGMRWTPSIHMPRRLSRLDLEITDVHVEQLARMPGHDLRREGVPCPVHDFTSGFCISQPDAPCLDHYRAFAQLWDGLNPAAPWSKNPWVWVVSFKRCTS